MIMHQDNLEAGKRFGLCHGFKVCMGAHYLRGFIRDNNSKHDWLKDRMDTWERNIQNISKIWGKYT